MTPDLLQKVGLTTNQAMAYLYLLQVGSATAPDLAKQLSENRTNAYMLCDRLVELGLAHKRSEKGKNRYYPANPGKLTELVEKKRKSILEADSQLKTALPQMISTYFAHSEQPGVQFFEGKEGLTKVYEDHLRTKADIYLLRTPADETELGDILYKYMGKRAKLGIKTHMLGPYSDGFYEWASEHDQEINRDVTWFPPKSYTAPVEISTYGDKVSLISFGKETVGTIVESPQIAEAFRQVFDLMKTGAEAQLPDKNKSDSVE